MAKLYDMCNDIDSGSMLEEPVELSGEEQKKLKDAIKDYPHKKRKTGRFVGWGIAAAAAAVVLLLNTSSQVAYAMGNIPVLGIVFKAITIRQYEYSSERFEADIAQPEVVIEPKDTDNQEILNKTEESVSTINESVEEMTDRLITEFEEQVDLGESYGSINVDHQVVTDTDKWFTLQVNVCSVAGSGSQYQYYYHIDKTTGEIASLKDLLKEDADYVGVITGYILEQMQEQMAADENKTYFITEQDKEYGEGWAFEKIKEDQNFYLNEAGNIVICFDEYEVAPGYMGLVQFEIPHDVVAELLK